MKTFKDRYILPNLPSKELYIALCKYAESKGVRVNQETMIATQYKSYPNLNFHINKISGNSVSEFRDYTIISIDEFIEMCDNYKSITMKLTESYNVVLGEEGIQVGCQLVTWEKFDELTKLVNKFKTK